MKLTEIVEKLSLTNFSEIKLPDREVTGGYTCDLLSDVMGSIGEGQIWITLQSHKNVAAVSSLRDVAAVLLVKGIQPDTEMLQHAEAEGVPVLGTKENSFNISGKLYQLFTT